jgi:hypothetical protein
VPGDQESTDGDDNGCLTSEQSLLYPATGCTDTNAPGFDGVPYQQGYWPDATSLASPSTKPTPIDFGAPLTGSAFSTPYSRFAFEETCPATRPPIWAARASGS